MDVVDGAMNFLNIQGEVKREITDYFILRYPSQQLQEGLSHFLT